MTERIATLNNMCTKAGMSTEQAQSLQRVAWTTIDRRSSWNWMAAGLKARTLSAGDMYEDLVILALAEWMRTDTEDSVDLVRAVDQAWGKEQYKNANVTTVTEASGQRYVHGVSAHDMTDVDYSEAYIEPGFEEVEDAVDAKRLWERILPYLDERDRVIVHAMSVAPTWSAAAEMAGVSHSTVQRRLVAIREKVHAAGLTPS
jgi:hypothetical protein